MKAKIRIPTKEYAFIEIDMDGTEDEILETHNNLLTLVNDTDGLNQKEWAQLRNNFVNNGEIDQEKWEQCSKIQKYVINEIKKSIRS